MPTLRIKNPAEKDIRDLPADVRDRITSAILALRDDPLPHGVRKLQGMERHFRLRIGDYRILYEFESAAQTIIIYRVKHRREAYR